jgi:hypothetical protein
MILTTSQPASHTRPSFPSCIYSIYSKSTAYSAGVDADSRCAIATVLPRDLSCHQQRGPFSRLRGM